MKRKTCLRCDWEGDTPDRACPDCGATPLYVLGARPSVEAETPAREPPTERDVDKGEAETSVPGGPPPEGSEPSPVAPLAVGSSHRSTRVTAAIVVTALMLTVALAIVWRANDGGPVAARTPTPTQSIGASAPIGGPAPDPDAAAAPGSLVRLDPATGAILERVPFPAPTLVAADGASIWAYGEGTETGSTLVRVDASTNDVTGTFDAPRHMTALAAVGGGAWLGDEHGNVYRLDGDTLRLGLDGTPGPSTPNYVGDSLIAAAGTLWVSAFPPGPCCSPPPDLYRIDPATGGEIAQIDGAGVVVASDTETVWAFGESRRAPSANRMDLVRIDTDTYATQPYTSLSVPPTIDVVATAGSLWTPAPQDDAISRLELATGDSELVHVDGSPSALAEGGGAVWAAIGERGVVARYDPATDEVRTIDVGGTPSDLVFAEGSLWVSVIEAAPPSPVIRRTLQVAGTSMSFNVPTTGWERFGDISINKSVMGPQGAEAILFWTSLSGGARTDSCAYLGGQPAGASVADLASAVATAPGTALVSGPTDVSVGERPAKHVTLFVRRHLGCDPGFFYTWHDRRSGALWPRTDPGTTIEVWIVDVGATPLFIEAETTAQAGAGLKQEIQRIIDSIRFGGGSS